MQSASSDSLRARLLASFPDVERLRPGLFVVGGAIRDVMIGVEPFDVDLVGIDALQAAEEFARLKETRVVQLGREPFTVYRVPLGDYYYDFSERIGSSLEEDLARRDFTMNALAVSLADDRLVDPFGGENDIRAKLVRMVSESNLDDDPLRILRAVRLATRYGFTVEEKTLSAIRSRAGSLENVAAERVTYELNAILSRASRYHGVELLRQTGIDRVILGAHVTEQQVAALLRATGSDPIEGAAILLAGRPREDVEAFAERWRWSDAARRDVIRLVTLVKCLTDRTCSSAADLAVMLYDGGEATARRAVVILTGMGYERIAQAVETLIARRGREIFSAEPHLSGEEIQAIAHIDPGPEVGRAKRALLEAQLRGEVATRDDAVALVKGLELRG